MTVRKFIISLKNKSKNKKIINIPLEKYKKLKEF